MIIFVGFMFLKIIKVDPERTELSKKETNLLEQIRKEEEIIEEQEQRADYYRSAGYKEMQARLKLNYKKPGETVIFVYDNPSDVESRASESEEVLPIWKKILDYIGL